MGFMTLRKGQQLTDEELALLPTRQSRSYSGGDSGTGGHGGNSAGGSDGGSSSGNDGSSGSGGTGTANGSTSSNNNKPSSSALDAAGRYDEDGDGIGVDGFSATALGYSSPFSAAENLGFGYSDKADFSGGLSGDYGGINVGNVSSGNYGTSGYSLNTGNDFSSGFDSYDNYGGLDGLDGAYDSGFMDSPSWMDKAKNFVVENPLAVTGGLLGLATLGPMGALSLSRLGSMTDDVTNPETSGLNKAASIMGMAGMPGMMGLAAKGFAALGNKIGDPTAQGGSMVGDGATTVGNKTSAESKLNYTAPKVEYKFDPFGQSNGLMSSNGKISYSQLHKLVNEFKKKSGGLMMNRSLSGGI